MKWQINTSQKETQMSNQAGMGSGPFNNNGSNAGGLRAGMRAAMEVMQQNSNHHNHMPKEVTNEMIDKAAMDVRQNAVTLSQKNDIVKQHFNNIETAKAKTTQGIAAFEKAVMNRLGK